MSELVQQQSGEVTTYWSKSDFGGNAQPPWTLTWRKECGYGAISARAFKAGERILLERPTTWTAAWHPFTEEDKQRIGREIAQLSPGM